MSEQTTRLDTPEPTPRRPSWLVELRPERPTDKPELLLRMAIKRWLSRDGLRVVSIRPAAAPDRQGIDNGSRDSDN